ncbi:MAG: (d)CMP kinase [Alphaproteobacteria bacterium]|nr:(d)CMP kinase [Alphaproteobacteria bacterium]
MIVTVDGPSGSGKGTLSRKIADYYNLAFLDTGLLYRAVAEEALGLGLPIDNVSAIIRVAQNLHDVSLEKEKLRSDEVAVMASKVAVIPEVRQALLEFQRQYAYKSHQGRNGVVLDGRDTGTVICPDADFKVYLTSAVEVRAQRRQKELQNLGIKSIYSEVLSDMIARDKRDSEREISPLRPAIDAHIIDTSEKTSDEVFLMVRQIIDSGPHHFTSSI